MNFVDDELVHMPKGRTKQMRIQKKREPGTETLVEKIPLKAVCDDDIEKVDLGFLDNIRYVFLNTVMVKITLSVSLLIIIYHR